FLALCVCGIDPLRALPVDCPRLVKEHYNGPATTGKMPRARDVSPRSPRAFYYIFFTYLTRFSRLLILKQRSIASAVPTRSVRGRRSCVLSTFFHEGHHVFLDSLAETRLHPRLGDPGPSAVQTSTRSGAAPAYLHADNAGARADAGD